MAKARQNLKRRNDALIRKSLNERDEVKKHDVDEERRRIVQRMGKGKR